MQMKHPITRGRRDKVVLRLIARRRLKNAHETWLLALGTFFSLLLVSFFLYFTVIVKAEVSSLADGLPHISFVSAAADGMETAALLLSVATLLTVRTWAGLSTEAAAKTISVLHSMGATASQRRYLLLTELAIQYVPALFGGVTVGAVGGVGMAALLLGQGVDVSRHIPLCFSLWLFIILISGSLLILCYTVPHISVPGLTTSVSERLRRKGQTISTEIHGYRSSNTYRRQSFLKRLASKSVDFYQSRYRSLSLSLSVAVFYPVLAFLMIFHLLGASVLMDINPFDGVDTMRAVENSVLGLVSVILAGFILLTVQGLWSGGLLLRAQIEQRKLAGRAYMAMGMTEKDFRRVMALEIRRLLLRSAIYLLLFVFIANFCFARII